MAQPKAKTLADFRASHDRNVIIPNKIRSALAELLKAGPENWDYESDFAKRAGISTTDINMFREQFAEHVVETGTYGSASRHSRRVWFATAKAAKQARGE